MWPSERERIITWQEEEIEVQVRKCWYSHGCKHPDLPTGIAWPAQLKAVNRSKHQKELSKVIFLQMGLLLGWSRREAGVCPVSASYRSVSSIPLKAGLTQRQEVAGMLLVKKKKRRWRRSWCLFKSQYSKFRNSEKTVGTQASLFYDLVSSRTLTPFPPGTQWGQLQLKDTTSQQYPLTEQ